MIFAAALLVAAAEVSAAEPEIIPGKQVGMWIWTDARGIHLRWTSDAKPVLFTGSIELDKAAGDIKRLSALTGGWIDREKENLVVFSVTATAGLDGADVSVPGGSKATIDLQIDGFPADVTKIYVGEKLENPKALPIKLKVR
jgi:hypothetical protein